MDGLHEAVEGVERHHDGIGGVAPGDHRVVGIVADLVDQRKTITHARDSQAQQKGEDLPSSKLRAVFSALGCLWVTARDRGIPG